ncbi:MAG: alkaline phosphatase family protein, partial [Acidobacteria bacterium]|nr:alkaline phosphatase family protein [Acidobacteriota bacterium]
LKGDDALFLVSDHGFKKAKGVLHINELLFQKGFLEPDFQNPFPPVSHKMEENLFDESDYKKVPPSILKLGLENSVAEKIIKAFKKLGLPYPLFLKSDIKKSLAVMLTSESYGITINDKKRFEDGTVDFSQIVEIKEKIKSFILNVEYKGENVFKDAFFKEEVYKGGYLDFAPDVIFGDSDWGYSSAIRTLEKDPFALVERGVHSTFGIFLAYGRNIVPQTIAKGETSVEDITPLILYFLGEEIPKDLDGKVVKEIVDSNYLKNNPVEFCEIKKPERERKDFEGREIQQKLKSLGYM